MLADSVTETSSTKLPWLHVHVSFRLKIHPTASPAKLPVVGRKADGQTRQLEEFLILLKYLVVANNVRGDFGKSNNRKLVVEDVVYT